MLSTILRTWYPVNRPVRTECSCLVQNAYDKASAERNQRRERSPSHSLAAGMFELLQPLPLFLFTSIAFAQGRRLRTVKRSFENADVSLQHSYSRFFVLTEYQHSGENAQAYIPSLAFPQASGAEVPVHAGAQLPRNHTLVSKFSGGQTRITIFLTETAIPPVFGTQHFGPLREPRGTFVVSMIDLDPSTLQDPTLAQIGHFLRGNFEVGRTEFSRFQLLSNFTPAISEFLQATPPAGSDPHR